MNHEKTNRDENATPRWEKARLYFYKGCLAIDIIGIALILFGLILHMTNT